MRRSLLSAALVLVAVAAAVASPACAYDWSFAEPDAVEDGGAGDTSTSETSTRDGSTDSSTNDASPPLPTECKTNADCAATSYCAFADRACGAGEAGRCTAVPTTCAPDTRQACGCSGTVYANACSAAMKRDDLSLKSCVAPGGMFACGPFFCKEMSEYCVTDAVGSKCALYDSCTTAKCSCPEITKLGCSTCNDTPVGQVQVRCP
jgi:hypothetical protein